MRNFLFFIWTFLLFFCFQFHSDAGTNGYPSASRMRQDVAGHSISEGLTKCFHPEDWYWTIEDDGIRDFAITKTLKSTTSEYVVEASCILFGVHSSYKTHLRITYLRQSGNSGWKLDYVKSLGMRRVVTHRYDDCIKSFIANTCLNIRNDTDVPLEVGCDFLADGIWRRKAVNVGAKQYVEVGGIIREGNVTDFKIVYVERQ